MTMSPRLLLVPNREHPTEASHRQLLSYIIIVSSCDSYFTCNPLYLFTRLNHDFSSNKLLIDEKIIELDSTLH